MHKKLLAGVSYAVIGAGTWTLAASYGWSYLANRAFEPLGWWHALQFYRSDLWSEVLLAISALLAAVPFVCLTMLPWRMQGAFRRPFDGAPRPLQRGVTDNHGRARFGAAQDLLRDFTPPADRPGILIGALGSQNNAPLLFDNPNKKGPAPHCQTIAGPGGDKSTSSITRLWHYRGPRVVLDPSNEIGPVMTEALQDEGYTVHTIGSGGAGLNVLDWLDPSHPDIDADIATATGHIFDEKGARLKTGGGGGDPVWDTSARSLVNCLLSEMIFSDKTHTLINLRNMLSVSDTRMTEVLDHIAQNSNSSVARFHANGLRDLHKSDRTWASVMFTVRAATQWLANPAYAKIVSGNDLKTADILDPKTVVFVDLPLRTLIATPAIGRAVMGSLFNAVIHADGAGLAHRVLFELDEGALLGAMDEIELCYVSGRKYGAIMHLILQSDSQLTNAWGKERAGIIRSCCSWTSYNSIQDPDTAKRLSEAAGTYGVMARTTGDNTSTNKPWGLRLPSRSRGNVENEHEIKRNLLNADEILRAPSEQMWVLAQNRPYVVACATAPFYKYPTVAGRMSSNRFNYRQHAAQVAELEDTE
jgi:type IV secretion system protein VirD4